MPKHLQKYAKLKSIDNKFINEKFTLLQKKRNLEENEFEKNKSIEKNDKENSIFELNGKDSKISNKNNELTHNLINNEVNNNLVELNKKSSCNRIGFQDYFKFLKNTNLSDTKQFNSKFPILNNNQNISANSSAIGNKDLINNSYVNPLYPNITNFTSRIDNLFDSTGKDFLMNSSLGLKLNENNYFKNGDISN